MTKIVLIGAGSTNFGLGTVRDIFKSKHTAYLAMLADPIVDNTKNASKLLNTMLDFQKEYLEYLK